MAAQARCVRCPDIIYRIFDQLAPPFGCAMRDKSLPRPPAGGNGWDSLHSDIEVASRVCKQWREYALECSELWAYIAIPGKYRPRPMDGDPWWTWAEVLKRRSKEKPLVVCLDLGFVGEEGSQVIEGCLPRIKELCIHGRSELSENPILDVLKRNRAPLLEKFSLDLGRGSGRLVKCGFGPGELFCGSTPKLRRLTVKPVIGVLSTLALSRLTHFTVLHRVNERSLVNRSVGRTNNYDLYTQLLSMKSLEVLEIESDTSDELDWEGRAKIRFERLSEFVIQDTVQNYEQFLSKIESTAACWVEYRGCCYGVCRCERPGLPVSGYRTTWP